MSATPQQAKRLIVVAMVFTAGGTILADILDGNELHPIRVEIAALVAGGLLGLAADFAPQLVAPMAALILVAGLLGNGYEVIRALGLAPARRLRNAGTGAGAGAAAGSVGGRPRRQ